MAVLKSTKKLYIDKVKISTKYLEDAEGIVVDILEFKVGDYDPDEEKEDPEYTEWLHYPLIKVEDGSCDIPGGVYILAVHRNIKVPEPTKRESYVFFRGPISEQKR